LSLSILGAAAAAVPALAQQAPATGAPLQEVVVTGSRIRQNPVDLPAPLQISTAADIARTGEISVGDYLQRLPIFGSSINRSNNSSGNLGFPPDGSGIGAGASEVDLRYLGSKRALVLVDGKRWVRGSSGSGVAGAVDLNTLPANAIERIEVLQDGASAIYGSDAIGGVVNIITKREFDGFSATAYAGTFPSTKDGNAHEFDLSFGSKAERGRNFFDVSYVRQDGVSTTERPLSRTPVFGAPAGVGGSSATPFGRAVFFDSRLTKPDYVNLALNQTFVYNGTNPVYSPANPTGNDYHAFGTADRFNFQPYNFLITPNRRVNVFGKTEYDIVTDVVFRLTASYTNRRSTNQAAPVPLFLGGSAGSGPYLDNVFIPANQPYNPFKIDLNGATDQLDFLTRRPVEAGPRIFDQNVDTWVVGSTVEGSHQLGDKPIYWDVNFIWGRNNASQQGQHIFNARKLAIALGPVATCNATPGCVPFNIFGGPGSITPAMLAFTTFTQSDQSQQELQDATANVSGDLFSLPAGPFGYALGFEHRVESGSFLPDATVQAGETADVPAQPTDGSLRANEAYLELRAPLLADLPAVRKLELSAAVRHSDYDLFGSDDVFKGGLYWRVVKDLSLRVSYSQGFRAPNIGELFNLGSRFDSALTDPCSTPSAAVAANCAALGVPTGFQQLNPQISVQTGGNVALKPEKSDSWTAGFAYTPSWVEQTSWISSLSFDVTYYNIKLKGAIQALDAQTQLDSCVATLSPVYCSGIVRSGGGSIVAFANKLTNIGRVETDGGDLTIHLVTPAGRAGQFSFLWATTMLGSYKTFTPGPTGLVEAQLAGLELGSPTRGYMKLKSALTTDWTLADFTTSLTLRYLSKLTEVCPGTVLRSVPTLCSDPTHKLNELDSRIYADAQLSWQPHQLNDRAVVSIGLNNVFNTQPSPCRSCDLNSYDGTLYPVPGRFGYARVGIKF
jgi:iron complex outermembrane receptor protein